MHIRLSVTLVPLVAMILVSPVIQTTADPLPAPIGHRQPTQNDIPPSVRQEEAPSANQTPQQDSQGNGGSRRPREQRRTPSAEPDDVPRICNPC
jgi:hypothetical protein